MPKVDFREEVANVALAELLARNNIRYTSDCSPESNHRRWSIAGRIVSESFTDTLEPARLPP